MFRHNNAARTGLLAMVTAGVLTVLLLAPPPFAAAGAAKPAAPNGWVLWGDSYNQGDLSTIFHSTGGNGRFETDASGISALRSKCLGTGCTAITAEGTSYGLMASGPAGGVYASSSGANGVSGTTQSGSSSGVYGENYSAGG